MSTPEFIPLTDTTSAAYKQWQEHINAQRAALCALADKGPVRVFRPIVQLSSEWNWWTP